MDNGQGPLEDAQGSRSGFFAIAGAAATKAGVEIQSEIETYMIDGGNHEVKLQVEIDNKNFVPGGMSQFQLQHAKRRGYQKSEYLPEG